MSGTVSPSTGDDATTNHKTIRRWANRRNATPARAGEDADGALRFSFEETERFTEISWDEFFAAFEREGLAFVFQPESENPDDTRTNRFYKFVDRATV